MALKSTTKLPPPRALTSLLPPPAVSPLPRSLCLELQVTPWPRHGGPTARGGPTAAPHHCSAPLSAILLPRPWCWLQHTVRLWEVTTKCRAQLALCSRGGHRAEGRVGCSVSVCCFHCKQQICSGLNQMQIIRGCGSCTAANPNQTRQKTVIFLWDPQHQSQLCGCQQWGKASSGAGTH